MFLSTTRNVTRPLRQRRQTPRRAKLVDANRIQIATLHRAALTGRAEIHHHSLRERQALPCFQERQRCDQVPCEPLRGAHQRGSEGGDGFFKTLSALGFARVQINTTAVNCRHGSRPTVATRCASTISPSTKRRRLLSRTSLTFAEISSNSSFCILRLTGSALTVRCWV